MEKSKTHLDRTIRQLEILCQEKRNLLVVSDLHLSEGFDETEGVWSINEDFFFDDQFARFLQFVERQKVSRYGGAPWRLVLNGDVFDFRQVGVPRDDRTKEEILARRRREFKRSGRGPKDLSSTEKTYGPGTTPVMSDWRAARVYQGHKGFFQALAWFVAQGNQAVFIKGNHDIELHWWKVQMGIRSQLRQAYRDARIDGRYDLDWAGLPETLGRAALDRVFFLPWNYYEPQRVYIEHGQQFHASDSEAHVLYPVLPGEGNLLELTLGDLFGRYFVNKLEELFPLMDNFKPFSKGLGWILNKGLPSLLTRGALRSDLQALWEQLKHAFDGIELIREKTGQRLPDQDPEEQRQAELAEYGEAIGLGKDCVQKLDELKSTPQLRSGLGEVVRRPLGMALIGLLVLIGAIALLSLLGLNLILATLVVLGGAAAGGMWRVKVKMLHTEDFLSEKAIQIHKVLLEYEKPVKYVLMGHDHHAHLERVDDKLKEQTRLSEAGHFYVNSGTWTAVIVYEAEPVQNARQFSFVRVVDDTAHVMRWNDGGGFWEPVVLY
jgi:UDP-2,3-diacylglucosamine pyrophosphatase LpxH